METGVIWEMYLKGQNVYSPRHLHTIIKVEYIWKSELNLKSSVIEANDCCCAGDYTAI